MSAQTSVSLYPAAALAGQLYDLGIADMISRSLDDAAGANAGDFVGYLAEDTVKLPAAAGDVDPGGMGFLVWKPMREPTTPQFARYSRVAVLRRGRIWLTVLDTIAPSDATLYIKRGVADFGRISAIATNGTALPGIKCLIGATAGNLGLFDVDMNA